MTAHWNGRPPAPLDEVDGVHWLSDINGNGGAMLWKADAAGWCESRTVSGCASAAEACQFWKYVAPCLTPDQIAAQIAEAVKAEREACIATCNQVENRAPVSELIDAKFWIAQCRSAIRARGETA